jgi:hypothetical protein
MTTKKKSATVVALRLSQRLDENGVMTTPNVWHTVGEYPGLWHPTIAVPVDVVDGDEAWAKARNDDPGCPLELVKIDDAEADAGREAFAKATGESLEALMVRVGRVRPAPSASEFSAAGATVQGMEAERLAAEYRNADAKVTGEE